MRVVSTELRKLFSNKIFLLIVFIMFILNAYLFIKTANSYFYTPEQYRSIHDEISEMTEQEKMQWIDERANNTNADYNYNWKLLFELQDEFRAITDYNKYLDNIDAQAKSMTSISIFSDPNSFNYKSILKTPKAYENVRDVTPIMSVSRGVLLATNNSFTDLLCGFILLFAVLTLMISDREQGMSRILFALPKGRGQLIFSKMTALGITLISIITLLFIENILICSILYGIGDLLRPIQSVKEFIGCNLKINVLQYFILYVFFKFAAFFLIGSVMSLIAVMTKNSISFYSISLGILIIEGVMYSVISPLSVYSVFRYINLISFTKVNEIFCNYKNINFFENPVSLIPASSFSVITAIIVLSVSTAYIYSKKRNLEFKRVGIKIYSTHNSKVHSKMYYTLYKSLILQKGILIILFSIFAFAFINTNFKKDYNIQDIYYQYYINEVDGEITEQTDSYISAQERYFADLKIQMNDIMNNGNPFSSELTEIQKKLAPEMGFVLIKERYEQIKNIENSQLFYDTGYKRMFGKVGYNDDMKYALVTMLMCIFLISPLIANDNKYRMQSIINSTASGKKKYIRRNIIAATIFGLISAVIWLIGYSIKISQFYGFSGLDAPIQSITEFVNFPVTLKVWQYLALIYILRTIAVIVSALIMLFISSKCKNTTMSVLVNFAVFALPIIVYLLGADIMVNIGMNPFLSVNAVMNMIFK